jgi:hypothetical protein
MEVTEFLDGNRRSVSWSLPDTGWSDVAQTIDTFLAEAIATISVECTEYKFHWLEICLWGSRLLVYPSENGPFAGERTEPIYYQLCMSYFESEFNKLNPAGDAAIYDQQAAKLLRLVWDRVERCLREGSAHAALTAARHQHSFKLAAFDYDPREGMFQLPTLDELAAEELRLEYKLYQEKLAKEC